MATHAYTTSPQHSAMNLAAIPLSQIALDPAVAEFFRRGEEDGGATALVILPKAPNAGGNSAARAEVEDLIETLIGALDLLDGDADLEDGADAEPWLGIWGMRQTGNVDDDREHDTSDDEYSLGGVSDMEGTSPEWVDANAEMEVA